VKIGFKFQSLGLGKISNISAADPHPSYFRSIPTLLLGLMLSLRNECYQIAKVPHEAKDLRSENFAKRCS